MEGVCMIVEKPWGYYETLTENSRYLVKKLVVFPHQRLSLQKHFWREEHWYIVQGMCIATKGLLSFTMGIGEGISIPHECIHRIENHVDEDLIIIEVQHGINLLEEDIVRYKDDYGRVD
jgi:mannose-1-phosphate guanylyltransferase / mannose-6-phosphate isomerase